eukprot:TRINITY_DN68609_c0_g1_i1.p1 TRINITY_DN68609_c0_g1~~TRINITY_DN68609_c0_g1_i1.p1  ORF type:complete len:176 (-),score=24.46 TRINITY_DN68609_c0_g1_i1:57-539(-)
MEAAADACRAPFEGMGARRATSRVLLPALVALAHCTAAAGDAAAERKRVEWTMCTALCNTAQSNRMVLPRGFTMECQNWPKDDGNLRILDRFGIELLAYQPCGYGSGMGASQRPLWISRIGNIWDQKYKVQFKYPSGSDRNTSVEVHLTKGLPGVGPAGR